MRPLKHIRNSDLRLVDVPLSDADLREIGHFADCFDPTEHWKEIWSPGEFREKSQALLAETIEKYSERGVLPDSLAELRTCLMEWAILPYIIHERPTAKQEMFLRDLVRTIRNTMGPDA
jgi:hypothetical protein